MARPYLGILKVGAVLCLVALLKSCSSGAGLAGGSGKTTKATKTEGSGGGGDKMGGTGGSDDRGAKRGRKPSDNDLGGNGKGPVEKSGDDQLGVDFMKDSDGVGPGENPNDKLIAFDPQFKNLSSEQFVVSATSVKKPLDLIIAVDTSGSMGEEALKVQQNVSTLTQAFAKEQGLDYHIWIVADNLTPQGVDPTKVSTVARSVGSTNALGVLGELITGVVPLAKPFRPDTQKAFVVVTDDNAQNVTSAPFTAMVQRDPRFKDKTSFNALVWIDGVSQQSPTCAGENAGTEYITLAKAKETAGKEYDLCANDWNPLFVDLGNRLVQQTVILEYKLKSPADPQGSFVVGVNGVKLDASAYSYDAAKNAIIFAEGKAPAVGANVVVAFQKR